MGLNFKKIYIHEIYTCFYLMPSVPSSQQAAPRHQGKEAPCAHKPGRLPKSAQLPNRLTSPCPSPRKHGPYLRCASFFFFLLSVHKTPGLEVSSQICWQKPNHDVQNHGPNWEEPAEALLCRRTGWRESCTTVECKGFPLAKLRNPND